MKISNAYDAILSKLKALFPSKKLIPYSYDLENANNWMFLDDGYGIAIGSESFEQLDFCRLTTQREISIILTRDVWRTSGDVEIIHEEIKKLLEDASTVQQEFYSYSELEKPEDILKIDVLGSGEIEEVVGDKTRFLSIRINFGFWFNQFIKE